MSELKEKAKEKLKERLNEKAGEISLLQRKRFWLSLLLVTCAVLGFVPAPENSGSKMVGIVQTIFKHTITLGFTVAFKYGLKDKGVAFTRTILGAQTEIDDLCSHTIVERENYQFHIIRPKSLTEESPAIVSIHGGGWVLGAVNGNYKFYSQMALSTQSVVIAPDYRLAPESLYPAAINDVCDTIEYAYNNAAELNINSQQIIVTGDSVGGGMTLSAALILERDSNVYIKGLMPVYPVTQAITVHTPSYHQKSPYLIDQFHMAAFFSAYFTGDGRLIEKYSSDEILTSVIKAHPNMANIFKLRDIELPELSDDTPALDDFGKMATNSDVSPLLAEVELLATLPPTKIYVSEHDVLKDDGLLMYSRMKDWDLNVEIEEWTGAIHGQLNMAAQFGPVEVDPQATAHVAGYFADLREMIERPVEEPEVQVIHDIPDPEDAYFDDEEE